MPYEPLSRFIPQNPNVHETKLDTQTSMSDNDLSYKKDFDTWNSLKKNIQSSHSEIICNEREVWWCSLGLNIGHEQDGKNEMFERPMLIIRKFSKFTCLCLPLTTSLKSNSFHQAIPSFGPNDFVVTSQIRLMSTKRFLRKFERIVDRKDFRKIKEALHKIIG